MANPVRRPPGLSDAWRPMLAGGAAIGVVVLAAVPFLTGRSDPRANVGSGETRGGVPEEVLEAPIERPPARAGVDDAPADPSRLKSVTREAPASGSGDVARSIAGPSGLRAEAPVENPLGAGDPAAPPQAKGAVGPQIIVGLKGDPRAATMLKLWNSDREGARRVFAAWAAAQRGAFDGLVLVDANPWSQELVLEVGSDAPEGVAEAMRRLRACPAVEYAERNTIGTTQDRN